MFSPYTIVAICAAILLSAVSARADIIDDLEGEWRAVFGSDDTTNSGELTEASLTLTRRRNGFRVSWTAVDGKDRTVEFSKVEDRAFYAPASQSGILSMFSSEEQPNPLAGQPLTWARLGDNELVLYNLEIAETGAYGLLMNTYTKAGDGFDLDAKLMLHGEPEARAKSKLQRIGSQ